MDEVPRLSRLSRWSQWSRWSRLSGWVCGSREQSRAEESRRPTIIAEQALGSTLKHFHTTSSASRQGVKANHRALDVKGGVHSSFPFGTAGPSRLRAVGASFHAFWVGSLGSAWLLGQLTARTAGRAVGRPSQAAHHFQRSRARSRARSRDDLQRSCVWPRVFQLVLHHAVTGRCQFCQLCAADTRRLLACGLASSPPLLASTLRAPRHP